MVAQNFCENKTVSLSVTAKFDRLDPKPANAIYCPPGYFSANTTGPCEVCGLGYWCPGGYQSTPRRVHVYISYAGLQHVPVKSTNFLSLPCK